MPCQVFQHKTEADLHLEKKQDGGGREMGFSGVCTTAAHNSSATPWQEPALRSSFQEILFQVIKSLIDSRTKTNSL